VLISTPRILITDDDRDFRETLRGVFEPRGFETLVAADGEQALEIVRLNRIHLLLTDMHMPRMTGLEAIRRIKEFSRVIPCILISAGLDETLVEEARKAEAFSVLPKPVRFREVTLAVSDALQVVYGWPEGEGASVDEQ
jgi:CheY-like chemotaxis protein